MAFPDFSGTSISSTYNRVVQYTGGTLYDGTGSLIPVSSLLPGLSNAVFYLNDVVPDVVGYDSLHSAEYFVSTSRASESVVATTGGDLIKSFITDPGYPGVSFIPAGNIQCHYETEKNAGSNNYYTYYEVYKRSTGSVETLLLTSDNSNESSVNTIIQNTVNAIVPYPGIALDVTDRIVVKYYAKMLSATATIFFYYDNNTNSRVELPTQITRPVNTGSFATTGSNTFIGNQTITGSARITGSVTIDGNNLHPSLIKAVSGSTEWLSFVSASVWRVQGWSGLGKFQSNGYGAVGSNYYFDVLQNQPRRTFADAFSGIEFSGGGFLFRSAGVAAAGSIIALVSVASIDSLGMYSGSAIKVNAAITGSSLHISGSGTNRAKIVGSGSTILSVVGSQGTLFEVNDSLSGSLYSVNDISGLPVFEVFSDGRILMGSFLAPVLITTKKLTVNSGSTLIYVLPTASYDLLNVEYSIRSASNASAGNITAMWSGSSVTFSDSRSITFGSTSNFYFGVLISGGDMQFTGSTDTNGWTVKTSIRSI